MKLLCAHSAFKVSDTVAELVSSNRGHASTDASVVIEAPNIRESVAPSIERVERPSIVKTTMEVHVIREADSRDAETPPRMEEVTRAAGEPADIAKPESEAYSSAPAEE